MHLHMSLPRAHPALEVAGEVVDALDERHALEDRRLGGRAAFEICVERLGEVVHVGPHRTLQLGEVGAARLERGRAVAQEGGPLAGKDVGRVCNGGVGNGGGEIIFGNMGVHGLLSYVDSGNL